MYNNQRMVKSTININGFFYDEIKKMVSNKEVASLTAAINDAITLYLKEMKRRKFAEGMMAAANDPDFINDNNQIEEEFEGIDAEVEGKW